VKRILTAFLLCLFLIGCNPGVQKFTAEEVEEVVDPAFAEQTWKIDKIIDSCDDKCGSGDIIIYRITCEFDDGDQQIVHVVSAINGGVVAPIE